MLEFYEKRKLKRLLYSKPVIIALCIPAVFLLSVTWNAYNKEREAYANMLTASAELDRLKEREATLSQEIERLSTQRGVEEELREKYEVGKPGERMIVLVDKAADKEPASPPIKSKGFFGRMWEKLRD